MSIRFIKGCLLVYIGFLVLLLLFFAVPPFRDLVLYTAWSVLGIEEDSPVYYARADVLSICETLAFEEREEFCTSPDKQNYESFTEALNRHYPPHRATYAEFMTLVRDLPSAHTREAVAGYLQKLPDSCPPPDQCNQSYHCYFFFAGSVGDLSIFIDSSTGFIRGYFPARPRESD